MDFVGKGPAETMPRPGAIKTHFRFESQPYHPQAKYIHVVRNPKDVVTSYFYHTKNISGYKFEEGQFSDYFDLWMEGQTDYGDYFDFNLSWFRHRGDDNVLIYTYEDMKRDIRGVIRRVAGFLGSDHLKRVETDPQLMEDIVTYSSFEYMRNGMGAEMDAIFSQPIEELPPHLHYGYHTMGMSHRIPEKRRVDFFRKGIVNDWKNVLTPEQNQRLMNRFEDKTRGTGFGTLWVENEWV
jgi:hypothetical protein